ncbi:hypothetical protein ES703_88611 [subsurface metagenome]
MKREIHEMFCGNLQKTMELHAGRISELIGEGKMPEAWDYVSELDMLSRVAKNLDCKIRE